MSDKVAVVVGVGPGLGAALARRFARAGFAVALIAREAKNLAPVAEDIQEAGGRALAVPADAADVASLTTAFGRIAAELGPASVLCYNAGAFEMGGIMDITAAQLERCLRVSCTGALIAAQQVLPAMLAHKAGTLLFTGATASLRGSARFACLATAKFALRALAQSMARELGPQGIHVAHVIIDGQIDTPRARKLAPDRDPLTLLSPDAIAETYYQLHSQDPTSWTQELDVRPASEKF